MKMRTILVIAAYAILIGCSSNSLGYGGGGGGGGGGGLMGGHTTSVAVGASGNAFSPAQDTVATGSTVTWTWSTGPHTVTFETLNDSSTSMSSGTFQVMFATPGSYRYRCLIHSSAFGGAGMTGTIVVQ